MALQQQIWTLKDAAAAADQAKQLRDAWRDVGDTMADEIRRIRGLVVADRSQSLAELEARFTITTAQARAGDLDAAKLLTGLSQSIDELVGSTAATAVDAARIRGGIAGSLDETMRLLAPRGVQLPAFAAGGVTPVGEEGPALVLPPARIYNARQTGQLLHGGDTARLEAQVEALTREVAKLRTATEATRYASEATATHAAKTLRLLRDVTHDGEAMQTEIVVP